jgi:hypothetical protein
MLREQLPGVGGGEWCSTQRQMDRNWGTTKTPERESTDIVLSACQTRPENSTTHRGPVFL